MSKGTVHVHDIRNLALREGTILEGKPRKKLYKRWWFWLVVVVIVIIVASNSGKKSTPTSTAPSGSGTSTTAKSTVHKVGDTFQVGEYQITVSKLSTASSVGDPNGLNSKAQGQYYIVDLTIKNLDKTASTVDSNLFKIKGPTGNEYTSDTTGTMYDNDNASFFLQQLNPGVQETGKLVFDMPANLKGLTLELSGGFTSSDTATVQLN